MKKKLTPDRYPVQQKKPQKTASINILLNTLAVKSNDHMS